MNYIVLIHIPKSSLRSWIVLRKQCEYAGRSFNTGREAADAGDAAISKGDADGFMVVDCVNGEVVFSKATLAFDKSHTN